MWRRLIVQVALFTLTLEPAKFDLRPASFLEILPSTPNDTLTNQSPIAQPTTLPDVKMKYIHSQESLDIPQDGM
ncbi:unnamed protein product [Colletotrichum noveboracense]|uniref:Uncharacterized protein n=1 Tax=Colletotrichum noveboracense TaxID=2664923 RepID=A0A9W4RRW7_9PEZI|nr:unnamed protein product [Colletotrichum noveboracense]